MRILGLALLTVACRSQPIAGGGDLTRIPALGLRIRVPDGFSVRAMPDGVVIERANTRTHPELRLVRAAGGPLGGTARKLANGAELESTVEKREGGSGGEEQLLHGRLRFSGATYTVECHDQGEWPGPDVEWCVRALEGLAP